LIIDRRRLNAHADEAGDEILKAGALIEGDDGGRRCGQGFVGNCAALFVRRHETSLRRDQALGVRSKGRKGPRRQQIRQDCETIDEPGRFALRKVAQVWHRHVHDARHVAFEIAIEPGAPPPCVRKSRHRDRAGADHQFADHHRSAQICLRATRQA
jgi:hypothetical protein